MFKDIFKVTRSQTLIITLLLIAISFRFINLERKLYWHDEVLTSLRISGHNQTELVQEVFDGRIISVQELQQKYQYPNSEKSLSDAIKAFSGNAEHSPLYYLMARLWVQLFGNSVAIIRSLSAIISLLALPCIYWLCLELFESSSTGWLAIILIATSPFHVLYAQQARQYSLWTVAILLSSAALLKAMRLGDKIQHWAIYGVTVAIGLYSHLFFGLVAIGHAIYVVAMEKFRWSQKLFSYLLASLAGLLLFTPWLWLIVSNLSKIIETTASTNATVRNLPLRWLLNLSRLFFDLNQGLSFINPILYLTAVLSVYSLYFICRKTPKQTWLFILTLVGVTGIALIVPDLILGGRRSSITRYAIPCFLGIQIAVAYLLNRKITNNDTNNTEKKRWVYVLGGLIFSGVLSCAVSSYYDIWWHNSHTNSKYNPQVAAIVNQAQKPLLVTDELPGRVLAFSHLLKSDVKLQLVIELNIPKIPPSFNNVFLYRPSEALRQGIEQEQNWKIEPVYKDWLWKIGKNA
jgi:uncharacterized membrane protein